MGLVLSGMLAVAPALAVDAPLAVDPCAEVPPPPPDYPPGWLEDSVEAAMEAFVEERIAAIEAEGGVDPNEVPPPPPAAPVDDQADCDTSYRVVEIPGVRSWRGSCIDSLAEGPIVLKWKGATENGTFTLHPSSETAGAISEVLNGKQPGYTFTYQGKGRYRIEVVEENADGSPWLLDVVYTTKGKTKQCVAGNCITSSVAGGEAMIPLEAQRATCPRGE
jgi:hypothetical protein